MATYEEFVAWLEGEMGRRGWDRAELARQSGLNAAQISRLLSLERRAGPDTCRALARAFGLPPEDVFRRAGLLPRARQHPEGTEELVHVYTELTGDDRRRLLLLARALLEAEQE